MEQGRHFGMTLPNVSGGWRMATTTRVAKLA